MFRRKRKQQPEPSPSVAADVSGADARASVERIQYVATYASQAMSHDGWEHAGAYHYMMAAADNVRFVVVLPQHRIRDEPLMYHRGYDETMYPLIDHRDNVRKWGFLGFVVSGASVAEARITSEEKS